MPLHETDAFVLRTFTLKEADKVCIFFTRETGKVRGVAHGAKRLRSKYGASLEPFTEVSLVYFEKENNDLVTISVCDIKRSQLFDGISSELLGVMHYFAELVIEFFPDREPNEKVYRLLLATVDVLRNAVNLPQITGYFEVWILKLSGFFPDWKNCGICNKELNRELSITLTNDCIPHCQDCGRNRGDTLSNSEWNIVLDILTLPPSKFINKSHDINAINRINGIVAKLIARILERDLKSYDVLNRLKPEGIKN